MNWKVLIAVVQIANQARTRFRFIQVIIEILRQFDRSLVNIEDLSRDSRTPSAGYVYVIRENANGHRFKTGYRAQPPWRNRQLLAEMGESGDFVLIIPAKDAKTLESKLRHAYARNSRRGAWFALDQNQWRELLIIAALVMVAAGDPLGMSPVDEEVVKLAKNLLVHLRGLASAMWANRTSAQPQHTTREAESVSDDDFVQFSAIPEIDWEWESVLSQDYRSLPRLTGKGAYLSVIRDNDAKQGRVFLDDHPVKSIDSALVDRSLRFALEIVLMLKVDNKKSVRRTLLSSSRRRDSSDWVALSDETLDEIKRLATAEWHGDRVYVSPKTHFGLKTLAPENLREYLKLEEPAGYIYVVQGLKQGKHWKIWSSRQPKRWTRYSWRARELNRPRTLAASKDPFRFNSVIQAEHAMAFRRFLRTRYRQQRRKGGWFKLDGAQLEEIRRLGQSLTKPVTALQQ
ncbi:MAG: hypothetical protein OXI30_06535 [Chloroflexota bacterium]|nr:hypothetical protein [Chloroflexota bacterium]